MNWLQAEIVIGLLAFSVPIQVASMLLLVRISEALNSEKR